MLRPGLRGEGWRIQPSALRCPCPAHFTPPTPGAACAGPRPPAAALLPARARCPHHSHHSRRAATFTAPRASLDALHHARHARRVHGSIVTPARTARAAFTACGLPQPRPGARPVSLVCRCASDDHGPLIYLACTLPAHQRRDRRQPAPFHSNDHPLPFEPLSPFGPPCSIITLPQRLSCRSFSSLLRPTAWACPKLATAIHAEAHSRPPSALPQDTARQSQTSCALFPVLRKPQLAPQESAPRTVVFRAHLRRVLR